jgi:hypothetical protein
MARDWRTQNGRAGHRIVVRSLNQMDAKPVPGTEAGVRPFFSPDWQWLACFTGRIGPLNSRRVPLAGGPASTLCEDASVNGASGQGCHIVFAGAIGLKPDAGVRVGRQMRGPISAIRTKGEN